MKLGDDEQDPRLHYCDYYSYGKSVGHETFANILFYLLYHNITSLNHSSAFLLLAFINVNEILFSP